MGERIAPGLKTLLDQGKIRRSRITREMVLKEFQAARRDLETARRSHSHGDYKWATVQAYYSIFHAARGLLYNRGFREKSHRGLLASIRLLYPRRLSTESLEDFSEAMMLREEADYGLVYSEESASNVLESAEKFLEESKQVFAETLGATTGPKTLKNKKTVKP